MVDLLGSLSNDLFTWAETHAVGDPNALEAVLQRRSRFGVNDQLWGPLNTHQRRQANHLRRVEQADTWRARGSGTGDRREEAARANETWYRNQELMNLQIFVPLRFTPWLFLNQIRILPQFLEYG